jgi:hypothetical protein
MRIFNWNSDLWLKVVCNLPTISFCFSLYMNQGLVKVKDQKLFKSWLFEFEVNLLCFFERSVIIILHALLHHRNLCENFSHNHFVF